MEERIEKRLYDVKEAGKYLGRSVWGVRNLIWQGYLPQVRHGKRVMIDIKDMEEYVRKFKQEADHGDDLPEEEERPGNGTLG